MTGPEVVLAWHELRFRLACAEKTGDEFQTFFESIMEKVDPSFMQVKASGKSGDWKCDGIGQDSGTYFQVYAPEGLKVAETKKKIEEDFWGVLEKWGDKVQIWVFVWSAATHGLPPEIANLIQELREKREPPPTIEDWGREAVWDRVRVLDEPDRVALFGPAPALTSVIETTAAEVQTLLNYLVEQPIPDLDEDLGHVELAEKMDRNGFNDAVRLLIRAGFPVVKTVDYYVSNHPDLRFSQRVAVLLNERYEELRAAIGDDSSDVFTALVDSLAHGHNAPAPEYWAAVGVVAHYFELCDIFER
jgi:hypothetical protein